MSLNHIPPLSDSKPNSWPKFFLEIPLLAPVMTRRVVLNSLNLITE